MQIYCSTSHEFSRSFKLKFNYRNKLLFLNNNLITEKKCPLCGVELQEIDVEKHFEIELEKLNKAGLLLFSLKLT